MLKIFNRLLCNVLIVYRSEFSCSQVVYVRLEPTIFKYISLIGSVAVGTQIVSILPSLSSILNTRSKCIHCFKLSS